MNILKHLIDKGVLVSGTYPKFIETNIHYLVQMGSVAYGASNDKSDIDIYGFCIPYKEHIFPHLYGQILGFGNQIKRFETWNYHHLNDISRNKMYDFSIHSIIKYFQLCMKNNPNIIDSLFVPDRCILHSTNIGNYVRENRRKFLHKGCFHKFKGYSYSQIKKMQSQTRKSKKRTDNIEKFGYDLKFAMHCIRLLLECEQILLEKDINLERNSKQLLSIRNGEWKLQEILDWFSSKEKSLEELYSKSDLPLTPNEDEIKSILLSCLEMHFGSLDSAIKTNDKYEIAISKIRNIVDSV